MKSRNILSVFSVSVFTAFNEFIGFVIVIVIVIVMSETSPLWVVIRSMSMYTECDLIIGIFLDEKSAIKAVEDYKSQLIASGDTHASQGYMTVKLDHDIVIDNIDQSRVAVSEYKFGDKVYVEFSVLDGFGQINHGIAYVTPNLFDLKHREDNRVEEDHCYETYDEIIIGSIRYDNTCIDSLVFFTNHT
jgi:hypothetical protein